MAGPIIESPDEGVLALFRPRRGHTREQLLLLCDSVADVVDAAGGWIFDRGLAGCDVTVLLTDETDDRALRILGADALRRGAPGAEMHRTRPDTLMLSTNMFRNDARVRQRILQTVERGFTNVMMWGDSGPAELDCPMTSVEHRLSIAARAFKKEALAAVGAAPKSAGLVETFHSIGSGVQAARLQACEA